LTVTGRLFWIRRYAGVGRQQYWQLRSDGHIKFIEAEYNAENTIGFNMIGDAGTAAIVGVLTCNETPILGNGFGSVGMAAIVEAMSKNRSLRQLWLAGTELVDGAEAVAGIIAPNEMKYGWAGILSVMGQPQSPMY
jgi:hypothetical protein